MTMDMAQIDLSLLKEAFETLADVICDNWDSDEEPSPILLKKAVIQLLDILNQNNKGEYIKPEDSLIPDEIDELGDYGLTLLQEMSAFAADLGISEVSDQMEDLTFPLAVWLVRQNSEIKTIEPIVNAFARQANHINDASHLKQLFNYVSEIMESIDPKISQDLEKTNPNRPWRIMIINRAIIATRSHDKDLMKNSFDTLIEYLPEDAPRFFEEGVEQMHSMNYPEHVKELMQHYYLLHGSSHTLH